LKHLKGPFPFVLAGVLAVLGLTILLSLVRHLAGAEGVLALPGQALFATFLWEAFFIPLYLLLLAPFLLIRRFSGRGLVVLNLFILPFVTASVFHKVLLHGRIPDSFLPDLLVRAVGRTLAAVLLLLVILCELLLIVVLRRVLERRSAPQGMEGETAGRRPRGRPRSRAGAAEPAESASPPRLPAPVAREERSGAAAVRASGEAGQGDPHEMPAEVSGGAGGKAGPGAGPKSPVPQPLGTGTPAGRSGETGEAWFEDAEFEAAESPGDGPKPARRYGLPIKGLLKDYPDGEYWEIDAETRRSSEILKHTLEEFKITAEVTGIRKGPVITMFEVLPSPGVKISRIVNLADNIALRLAASRVRIVAPIPGKHAVGIEVPNKKRAIVSFKEMISLPAFQESRMEIPIALGKDISGEAQIIDLTQTPHVLIAGATGSGKSVCVNSIISSILYSKSPADVRFLLIDPKIVELKAYNDIPHLLTPVITEPKRAFQALQYCIEEMERRYSMLDYSGARDIRSYNRKAAKLKLTIQKIPYWVVIVDEFADLIATTGKEMEAVLARLAAMARAVGIHLVLATQRPSIDVITGLIKANIPSRIAFMVAGKFDSRIIIDAVGAEKLLGQGDMLFSPSWNPVPVRIQGTYLSEEEIEAITAHARTLGEPEYVDEEMFFEEEGEGGYEGNGADDPLMDKALEIVMAAGKASASYLQRRLKVGYNRAARLVEEMERMGIVGPAQGSKPRDILHVPDRS
jgi:DNA segregation ATPase FtsK/SpoIIIE-like protein